MTDASELGVLNSGFEIQNQTGGAGRPTRYAVLTEEQAVSLLTASPQAGTRSHWCRLSCFAADPDLARVDGQFEFLAGFF